MNPINESLYRAYSAVQRGDYAQACEHLADAISFAKLANDNAARAGATRAYVTVARIMGKTHLGCVS